MWSGVVMGAPGVIGDRRYVSWKTMFSLESFSIYILGFYSSKDHMVQLKWNSKNQISWHVLQGLSHIGRLQNLDWQNVYVNNSPSFLYFIKISWKHCRQIKYCADKCLGVCVFCLVENKPILN